MSRVLQSVPFRAELVKGLSVGRSIIVRGEINHNANRYEHSPRVSLTEVGGASEGQSSCLSVSQLLCQPASVRQQRHRSSSQPSSKERSVCQKLLPVRVLGPRGDHWGAPPLHCGTVLWGKRTAEVSVDSKMKQSKGDTWKTAGLLVNLEGQFTLFSYYFMSLLHLPVPIFIYLSPLLSDDDGRRFMCRSSSCVTLSGSECLSMGSTSWTTNTGSRTWSGSRSWRFWETSSCWTSIRNNVISWSARVPQSSSAACSRWYFELWPSSHDVTSCAPRIVGHSWKLVWKWFHVTLSYRKWNL